MMVILFFPSLESKSLETRVEVSSIRLGEAVKRLTTQLVLFFLLLLPRVYIYTCVYAGSRSSSAS